MRTYQDCIKEYAIAFIFNKDRAQVVKDTQECRSARAYDEEET